MYKHRVNARIDKNQLAIVNSLRSIPNVTVELNKDDILVGYRGKNYWYEIKSPDAISKKTGKVKETSLKPSQVVLRDTWEGHYKIVTSLNEILRDIMGGE
ncbi:MAG: hypothetical protein GY931_11530 [Maribacter sp.]|nr:hypothetical protein [Maribacter sp.]